ncbi:MAG: S46 family peptidase [Bacteroidales bacterium]|nr:S46 family peptidase [Bacteroidales bacterium]
MKIRFLIIALALGMLMPATARADEGMWLLSLLGKNYADMQKAGFKLTVEDIYSINQSCLKDAVVGLGEDGSPFNHFCTGEIVSPKGLMTTNHHCGYEKLQQHSSVGHDYLRDGFWAYSMDQELPNPGMTASILVRMEDVTDRVKAALSDEMSENERERAIAKISKQIEKQATEGTDYAAHVESMFNGNQFFLFVHIVYKDVRLVGAPPSSMGKFGGDTDNWMWPRHTCDFSMFRIYTAPDGSPAEYSADNVPLKPKHFLPVSNRELKEGDYAMVMGFPGTTDRFLTSFGLKETEVENQLRYEIRSVKINILREEMAKSQAVRIKYDSKYAECSNYWKYSDEQNKALKQLNTMGVKLQIEQQYRAWASDKDKKYREALTLIEKGYADRAAVSVAQTYCIEGLLIGPELPWNAYQIGRGCELLDNPQYALFRDAVMGSINELVESFYKDYNAPTEQRLEAALFRYVFTHLDQQFMPEFLIEANKKYKGNFEKYVADLHKKSIFADEESCRKFLAKPDLKKLAKDPVYLVGSQIYDMYTSLNSQIPKESKDGLERGIRNFTDGILQINEGHKLMSPDANSTIRLTYGNVKAYEPRDAVAYSYFTTLAGVLEKEGPAGGEFEVPARLKQLIEARDYGRYADKDGNLHACFVTTNDITGGNSGSPVMDAEGNLIGLAFDGNSESMSGDIDFEEQLQRCICLDTRYLLFVIDKYAGAKNLIDEMTIVE